MNFINLFYNLLLFIIAPTVRTGTSENVRIINMEEQDWGR